MEKIADERLADELIERLNAILGVSEKIRHDVAQLLEQRVPVHRDIREHSTLQCTNERSGTSFLGILGLLNGIVGVIPDGPARGWGHIIAVYSDDQTEVLRFERTVSTRAQDLAC